MARKQYPGENEAKRERAKHQQPEDEAPDFIGNAPNYDAFPGWSPEEVLVWLNID